MLGVGLAGTLVVGVALAWPAALGTGLALLGAAYALLLAIDTPPLDGRAAIVAAGVMVTGELATWSLELRRTSPGEAGEAARRLPWISLLGVGALAGAGAVLTLVDLARTEGIVVEAVGALAAVAVLALAAHLAHRGQRT